MARKLTASDRSVLIRLASRLPKGSEQRRAVLSSLQKVGGFYDSYSAEITKANPTSFGFREYTDSDYFVGQVYLEGTLSWPGMSSRNRNLFRGIYGINNKDGSIKVSLKKVYGRGPKAKSNAEIAAAVLPRTFRDPQKVKAFLDLMGDNTQRIQK